MLFDTVDYFVKECGEDMKPPFMISPIYSFDRRPVPAFTLLRRFRFDFYYRKTEAVSCHVIRGKSREV
jgi:hypothetical protein